MTLYVISGLGADFSVLSRINFPPALEVKFIPWIIPQKNERWEDYIQKMIRQIDEKKPFSLLGYSFGGIIAQEIAVRTSPQKVVILGSPRHHRETSKLLRLGQLTKIPSVIPTAVFGEKGSRIYFSFRKFFVGKKSGIGQYFQVRDAYYLKWSVGQILKWRAPAGKDIIQILADQDLLFPASSGRPDFIVRNATHLFPVTHAAKVSEILAEIFSTAD